MTHTKDVTQHDTQRSGPLPVVVAATPLVAIVGSTVLCVVAAFTGNNPDAYFYGGLVAIIALVVWYKASRRKA